MNKAQRMQRDESARKRRRNLKEIIVERTLHYYDKMRKLRKRKHKNG